MEGVMFKIKWPEGEQEFGISKFPNRKLPCLFRTEGSVFEILAYFKTEEKAEKFKDILNLFFQSKRSDR